MLSYFMMRTRKNEDAHHTYQEQKVIPLIMELLSKG